MQDELAARQRAIALRLSGRPVQSICQALGRSTFWFHKWWRRYLQAGAEALRVGKKHKGLYLRLVIDTGQGKLTAYLNGRVVKRWPYQLLND
jgi:hypothetical protein